MTENYDAAILEEVAALKREAVKRTGFDDFGDSLFEEPLAAWVNDLSSPKLDDFGRQFLRRLALRDLCRRLKVLAFLAEHPQISEVEIPPIIQIMGAPRTGSTLLHNLMAPHSLCRSFLRWELMEPLPPPSLETYKTDPRIAKVQASIEPLRGSMLERMHWVNADEPDENAWAFIDCTGLLGRGIAPIMPTWATWLENNDHSSTFHDYRKLVQLLIWKYPQPRGGHLMLKCVLTAARIKSFANVFPEANFILMHRDPFRILISSCTAAQSIYKPFIGEQPDPLQEDGSSRQSILKVQKMTHRALVDFAKAEPTKVTNVQYADLMSDAVLTTRSAYESIGMEAPKELDKSIIEHLEQQRSGKRAAPPKSYESFGYDEDTVWADSTVAQYCEFFGVQRERSRLIDTKTGL
jgi:hypothetical protein